MIRRWFIVVVLLPTLFLCGMEGEEEEVLYVETSDGHIVRLNKKYALTCQVLSDVIEKSGDEHPIPLSLITHHMLHLFMPALENDVKFSDTTLASEVHTKLQDDFEQSLPSAPTLAQLLFVANMLGKITLADRCMQLWAKREYVPTTAVHVTPDVDRKIAPMMAKFTIIGDLIGTWVAKNPCRPYKTVDIGASLWTNAVNSKGTVVATGCFNKSLALCNLVTNEIIKIPDAHDHALTTVQFAYDDTVLWSSCNEGGIVKVWDVATGVCRKTYQIPEGNGFAFCFLPKRNAAVVSMADRSIGYFDQFELDNPPVINWPAHEIGINVLAANPNETLLASISTDETVKIWDLATKVCKTTYRLSSDGISGNWNSSGSILASGSEKGIIALHDIAAEKITGTLEGHTKEVWSVLFADEHDAFVASCGCDELVKVWDMRTYKSLLNIEEDGYLHNLAYIPQSQTIISASTDGTVKFYDIRYLIGPVKMYRNLLEKSLPKIAQIDLIDRICHATEAEPFKVSGPDVALLNQFPQPLQQLFSESLPFIIDHSA